MMRCFCIGDTRAKTSASSARCCSAGSLVRSSSSPRMMAGSFSPTCSHTCRATSSLSPVRIFTCTPSRCMAASEAAASGFGGSAKARYPAERQALSRRPPHSARCASTSRYATASTRKPCALKSSNVSRHALLQVRVEGIQPCPRFRTIRERSRIPSGAPLVISSRFAAPPPVFSSRRSKAAAVSKSNGISSHFRVVLGIASLASSGWRHPAGCECRFQTCC